MTLKPAVFNNYDMMTKLYELLPRTSGHMIFGYSNSVSMATLVFDTEHSEAFAHYGQQKSIALPF